MKSHLTIYRFIILCIFLINSINTYSQIQQGTIGTGVDTCDYPFYTNDDDSKTLILFTATELQAAGLSSGFITQLDFDAISVDTIDMNGFKVQMQNSSLNTLNSFITTNWSTVYDNTYAIKYIGWNSIELDAPFYWDGVSNLLIQICFDNYTQYQNSSVRATTIAPPDYFVLHEHQEGNIGCNLSNGSQKDIRPNIKITLFHPTQTDMGILDFVEPDLSNSINADPNTTISVLLNNNGTAAQSNFNVKYSIDNGSNYISELFSSTINAGDTTIFTFTQTANFSNIGQYNLIGTVELANDSNAYNDTIYKNAVACNKLNGTYTVGNGKDFNTLTDAIDTLKKCGVYGPTTLLLDEIEFDATYVIENISGLSSINTLTIKGLGHNTVLLYSNFEADSICIIELNNTQYVSIENITIKQVTPLSFSGIHIGHGSHNTSIINCVIDGLAIPTINFGITASGRFGFDPDGSIINNTIIDNNEINNCFLGIALFGTDDEKSINSIITNNNISNSILSAIVVIKNSNIKIEGNTIKHDGLIVDDNSAMIINDCDNKVEINKNIINYSVKGIGIYMHDLNESFQTNDSVFISNNMIQLTGESTGIESTDTRSVHFYNNTIRIDDGNTESKSISFNYGCSNIKMYNNNLYCENGYALYSSMSDTALHSDYNNFYSGDSVIIYFNYHTHYNLTDYSNDSYGDDHSISVDPLFYTPTNLHANSYSMNNAGTPIAYIQNDIDNDVRNASTPDIGADEYNPYANDIRIIEYIGPKGESCSLTSSESFAIIVKNTGTATQTNIPIRYSINNNTVVTETIASLNSMEIDTFEFSTNADLSPWGENTIKVYTDLSNDQIRINDTLNIDIFNTLEITKFPLYEDFEDTNYHFQLINNSHASAAIVDDLGNNNSKCIHMKGGYLSNWAIEYNFSQVMLKNKDHITSISTCNIDGSGFTKLSMFVKVKIESKDSDHSWFYVSVNDSIIQDKNEHSSWNTTYNSYATLEFVLDSFVGGDINIAFNGILKDYKEDNIYIDEILIYEPKPNDVGVISIITTDEGDCGSLNDSIFATIRNFGTQQQTNIPVNIDIDCSSPASFSALITDTLDAYTGEATVFLGTIDSYHNDVFKIKTYTTLSNDSIAENDTLINHIDLFKYHPISFIESFDNQSSEEEIPESPGGDDMTGISFFYDGWMLSEFAIVKAGLFGYSTNALAYGTQQMSQDAYAIMDNYIGIIKPQSVYTFEFKFNPIVEFYDSINFILMNCDEGVELIYSINPSNYINDTLWHTFNIPIGQFSDQKYQIGVYIVSGEMSDYTLSIDNFGIINTFVVDLGNDTTICFNDSLSISPQLNNEEEYHYLWSGPNVFGDTASSITVNTTGVYSVTVIDNYGKSNSDQIHVQFTPELSANISTQNPSICLGDSTQVRTDLYGTFPMIVNWKINNTLLIDTVNTVMLDYFSPDTNTLFSISSISDYYGCSISNADSLKLIINDIPEISLSGYNSQYCYNDESDTIIPSETGGVFQGGINQEGIIYPQNLGLGNKELIYIYTDANNCVNSDTINFTINTNPTVAFSNANATAYCLTNDTVLLIATPSGGEFDGSGLIDNLIYLDLASSGSQEYTYLYTDANGCSGSDTLIIQMNALPNVSIGQLSDACENTTYVDLNTAAPSGGSYFGTAVSTNDNKFFPAIAGIGTHNIFYNYIDNNGCQASANTFINVIGLPSVDFTIDANYCESDTAYINYIGDANATANYTWDLSNATIISGTGQGPFEVVWDTVGNKVINLMLTDSGCTNTNIKTTNIHAIPTVAFSSNINAAYCQTDDSLILSATPSGGQYFRNGPTNNIFHFNSVSPDTYQYSYTFTDEYGCTGSDTIDITINSLPTVSLSQFADACENDAFFNLNTATPSGGNYYGTGVSANKFFPASAGVGTHTILYNYIDSNGCQANESANINVISSPIANFSVDATVCKSEIASLSNNSVVSSSATFNWSFDNANIISGIGAGPYELSWDNTGFKNISLTVSDSGCTSFIFQNYTNVLDAFANISYVGNDSACYGQNVTLFTNSGSSNSFQWSDTSGNLVSTQDTLSFYSASETGMYFVSNTNSNGCTAISDTINITINPEIICDFTLPNIACNNDMVNVSYIGNSGISASYNWNFDSGIIASGSNSGPYNILWDTDGIKNVSLIVEDNNCSSSEVNKIINIQTTTALITVIGDTNFCEGGSVTLSANSGAYTYEWYKNGVSTSNTQALYQATQSGSYTVVVTDNNTLCSQTSDSINITVNTTDFGIAFSANQTNINIPPFIVDYNNQTTNANEYFWMWSFGDGNTSSFVNPSHQYDYNGNYTVSLVAQNVNTGCIDTLSKANYISCTGGSPDPCNISADMGNIGGNEVCPEDSVKFFAIDHTNGINYQWLIDGSIIAGATDSVLYASSTGLYQLMVSDTSCTQFSQPFALTQYVTVTPIILTNGSIQPCTNDSMELYVSTSFSTYQWSNGASDASIYAKTSGIYTVTISDNNACTSTSSPYILNASLLNVPDICIVGIDTVTNHNRVIWERQNADMIDSFRIYRESNVAGIYDLIGSQPFSTLSVFEDVNSNPAQMAYRYRITAVDTCGMETSPSPIHKTLHLTINAGLGGVWNLIWTNYEGFNFGSYKIYRSSDSTNMQLLTQIQSNLTSFTDLNPPTGDVYYQIEIVSPYPCYADSIYSKANTNYNTSRSNTANTANAVNTSLHNYTNTNIEASIYPNPNSGQFTIEIGNLSKSVVNMKVFTTVGKEIYSDKFNTYGKTIKRINLKQLPKGIYFIQLNSSDGGLYRGKIIIN